MTGFFYSTSYVHTITAGGIISGVDDYIDGYYIYAGAHVGTYINDVDLLNVKSAYNFSKKTNYSILTDGTYGSGSRTYVTNTYNITKR